MSKITRRQALTLIGTTGLSIAIGPSISLASNTTIICNWDKEFPPYSMEENGKMTGILVECMEEVLGKRMGYTIEHQGHKWIKAQDLVRAGKGDSLCTNPTDGRKQFMHFSEEPVIESSPSIFCSVNNPKIDEINKITALDQLKDYKVVDYMGNGWARRTFPPYLRVRYVKNLTEIFTLIKQGEADVFVGNGLAAIYAIKQNNMKDDIHARELQIGEPSSFHFGLRQDYPDSQKVIEAFDEALFQAQVEDATRNIIMKYL